MSGGQLKRAGAERWNKTKEKALLAELASHANYKRACAAIGLSYNAVLKRRRKEPRLEAACKAAIELCRARIPGFLAAAAAATFDPETLPEVEAGEMPKVTVAEALKIAQMKGTGPAAADPYDDPDYDYDADIADVRERLVQKLQAIRRRDRPALLEQGWSYDESWDREIPPGWVKGPNWRPGPGDEGEGDEPQE